MNRNALLALVAIVLAVGAFVVFSNQGDDTENNLENTNTTTPSPSPTSPTPSPEPSPSPTPSASNEPVTVSMTASGFSPSNITIKKGTTVTFVNDDIKPRQPASAPHPSHTDYPQFDPKQGIAPSDSWEFTFDRVGTWRYHDHLNPTQFGSVTVTE